MYYTEIQQWLEWVPDHFMNISVYFGDDIKIKAALCSQRDSWGLKVSFPSGKPVHTRR